MTWLREQDDEPIPGYRLVEPLGTGGFGEVWKCTAPGGLFKAIKFVYGNLNTMDGDSEKATQEFKALERIKLVRHTFVLSMDRIEVVGGELLIVMELADKSLHDCFIEHVQMGRQGIPRDDLLRYLADAAEGLDHLNEKNNLQHLDVKPKNLFLIADHVKVADFGLVKHLERQSSAGLMGGVTPVYAAPETFSNKISKHSDQYSLAVLFMEMLTGQRPFNGKNIRQLALQHMSEEPDLSMLSPEDRPVLLRALAKDPNDRFPNCVSFIRALSGQAASLPFTATLHDLPDVGRDTPPPAAVPIPKSDLSITATVSRLEFGVLRPSILIGVGSFGRRALNQIRARLLDRIGDLHQAPSFRFLYLDVEPSAAEKVQSTNSEAALEPDQLLMLPLQSPTAYRRKQIDQILEWLPREKLYAIPRSLSTEGSRALGRLAFSDHYLRVSTRLKHEINVATHPEAMKQTADQTGLAVRDKRPGVYVFASAAGGSGGMLLDLGHTIRRVLEKNHLQDCPITTFLYCGCPDDPSADVTEQANIYASLAELNHYADPDVTFTARYGGVEGPKLEAGGLPFTTTYLLPISSLTVEAYRDCLSHLSAYITQELTTPLGSGLEDHRRRNAPKGTRSPFRSFGTYGVWYPRGLLLRSASRQLCLQLLKDWLTEHSDHAVSQRLVHSILSDPRLTPQAIQHSINQDSMRGAEGTPRDVVAGWLRSMQDQAELAARRGDRAAWAIAVWDQARDAVGPEPTSDADSPYRRGRFSRSLDHGLHSTVASWDNEFESLLRPLETLQGPRLATLTMALEQLIMGLQQTAHDLELQLPQLRQSALDAQESLARALEASQSGSGAFSFFGSRSARSMRALAMHLRRYVERRCQEDLAYAAISFYQKVSERLQARQLRLATVREQLAKLIGVLETAPSQSRFNASHQFDQRDDGINSAMQITNTVRIVLPSGDGHIEQAAASLLDRVGPNEMSRLQDVIDRLVVEPRGGLEQLCQGGLDLRRTLAVPIIEQVMAFLTSRMPSDDVAEIELASVNGQTAELGKRIQTYLQRAAPQVVAPTDDERTFVLVPSTPAGLQYAAIVREQVPRAVAVTLQGNSTDLMFCRERSCLSMPELLRLIEPCWEAYDQEVSSPERSPHSRHDVSEWMPLVAN